MSFSDPCAIAELSIKCFGLRDLDILSKSDPLVIVYSINEDGSTIEIGRTECIRNDLNPVFNKRIKFDYYFERNQTLQFLVIDVDGKKDLLKNSDFLGKLEIRASKLFSTTNPVWKLQGPKDNSADYGTIEIKARNLNKAEILSITFGGEKLASRDFMGKSDPYIEVYRPELDGTFTSVLKTNVIMRNLNPSWKPISVFLGRIADFNDPKSSQVLIKCWDWNRLTSPDLIGQVYVTISDILQTGKFKLLNPKNPSEECGYLIVRQSDISREYTFTDYLYGGTSINLGICIDFTASNGNPQDPGSLHYIDPNGSWNSYMKAINCVGNILAPYDVDQMFHVYGFGAAIGRVMHDFNVNLNPQDPRIYTIDGVVEAYMNCLQQVTLSGPTNFAPCIKKFCRYVESEKGYFLLLIITDGVISDLIQTKDAICAAAKLPISIVIVGVGNEDFSNMEILDGDEIRITNQMNQPAERDIVQFVALRDYESHAALAAAVLHEIPRQFLEYMKKKGIKPSILPEE